MLLNKGTFIGALFLLIGLTSLAQEKDITLDDIYTKHQFNPERVWGLRSMSNGSFYTAVGYTKKGQEIVKFSYASGDTMATVFSSEIYGKPFKFSEYRFSPDETKIMFTTDVENIYRHSTRENVWIYDLKTKRMTNISESGKQRYSTFSPNGQKIAYVRDNNIFIYELKSSKETQVTTDGKFNHVINGATDWVYEEEFGISKALFWSPNNEYIAFYRFDETNVKEFNMIMYQNDLYPTDYRYKYPKAGEDNSLLDIYVYNVKKKSSVVANFPKTEYVPVIKWATEKQLAIQTLNRHQNDFTIHLLDASSNESHIIYHEKSETFVDPVNRWYFLPKSNEMLITSEKDGYKHIYSINYKTGIEEQLTKGDWDVTKLYGVMKPKSMMYYETAEVSPTQRHVYSMDLLAKRITKLSTKNGWNEAAFSRNFLFYINTYSNANTPYTITINQQDGKIVTTLVDNNKLVATINSYRIGQKEFMTIPMPHGTDLNAWIIKPADFDENKKYPVLITIYGGPGVQTVKDEWDYSLMWHQMLAQKGIIVVSVDNRGTGARGAEFKKSTYMQLGKLEIEDYIETAKWLGTQTFIDSARIGIWGWSYGGYMSTLAITKGADYFSTAIAVAPVTNWRYYDNIYTERYMRTPQENASGYDDNSPINFVKEIKGNYLLVHGTADDNVHFQNTAELTDALVKANIQYDFYMYTDKNHGIYGGNTRKHLFTKFTNYLLEKL